MGVSTNGILFFGFCLEEGFLFPWEEEHEEEGDSWEWEQEYAKVVDGIVPPNVSYEDDQEQWSKYWEAYRNSAKQSPVMIDTHCSCDYPMHQVAICDTCYVARRGYPERIGSNTLLHFLVPQREDMMYRKIVRFCELMRLPIPKEAEVGWHLASLWC
jgi:hypothetical protein